MSPSVSVAAELAVVRQPAVGGFDDPSQTESHRHRLVGVAWSAAALDDEIVETRSVQLSPDLGVVVAAVEVHRVDIDEQTMCCDRVECRLEQADVVAVRSVHGKDDGATAQVSTRVLSINVDVLAVQEVKNIEALQTFNREQLGGAYPFVVRSDAIPSDGRTPIGRFSSRGSRRLGEPQRSQQGILIRPGCVRLWAN